MRNDGKLDNKQLRTFQHHFRAPVHEPITRRFLSPYFLRHQRIFDTFFRLLSFVLWRNYSLALSRKSITEGWRKACADELMRCRLHFVRADRNCYASQICLRPLVTGGSGSRDGVRGNLQLPRIFFSCGNEHTQSFGLTGATRLLPVAIFLSDSHSMPLFGPMQRNTISAISFSSQRDLWK